MERDTNQSGFQKTDKRQKKHKGGTGGQRKKERRHGHARAMRLNSTGSLEKNLFSCLTTFPIVIK